MNRFYLNRIKLNEKLNVVANEERKRDARHKRIQAEFKQDYASFQKQKSRKTNAKSNNTKHFLTLKRIAEIVGINTSQWKQ